jgi:hypothetical protein
LQRAYYISQNGENQGVRREVSQGNCELIETFYAIILQCKNGNGKLVANATN